MANKQINELSELTEVEESDLLVVYDVDEGGSEKTKKILKSNFLAYEEGTWTPVISDASSGGNTASLTTVEASYIKVGSKVDIFCNIDGIDIAGMTGGNYLFLRGLPFADSADMRHAGTCVLSYFTFSGYVVPQTYSVSSNYVTFRDNTSGTSQTNLTVATISNLDAQIRMNLTYKV